MKLNRWLLFGAMLSTSMLAQQVTNPPPAAIETPAPAAPLTNATAPETAPPAPEATDAAPAIASTNAPAAHTSAKKAAPKKRTDRKKKAAPKQTSKPAKASAAAELRTVPLVAGPATVVASRVNVRGQAKLRSEVVTQLTKGQEVMVLEEIVRNHSAVDEPSAWARIALPAGAHVWVNKTFLDDSTVKATKLNMRSGPGENYSILGRLVHGDVVKDIDTKGDWMEIEAPTNAYAFVAAQYLKQEPPTALASNTPAEPAPTPSTVTEPPTIASAPVEAPANPAETNAPAETSAPANAPTEIAAAPAPEVEAPPPPRIVEHEGIVRGTTSIQAPTPFALYSADNGRIIDYLYTTSHELDLRRYKGLRIVVTGPEALEERWGTTPVITIQKIQVLEE